MNTYGKRIKIRDPIYGFIELDAQEGEIINSPYFQRLRRIKQLSLTDMVYPSACHTRFEHSLGVMQMASDMFDNIVRAPENLKLLNIDNDSIPRIRKILRLAALLHDIGHPPFSHAGESTMPYIEKNHPHFAPSKDGKPQKFTHEHYGWAAIRFLFRHIIEEHPQGKDMGITADDVLLLLGDESIRKYSSYLFVLKELISSQIDADRADYLLRDSLHLGVNYGVYDRSRFVKCLTLGKNNETGSAILAVEEGGRRVAESLVLARYQMFTQVYFHKVRRIFDYHVSRALQAVLKSRGFDSGAFPPPVSVENMEKYLQFDDWYVQGAWVNGEGGEHGQRILNRMPYKKVDEWEGMLTDKKEQIINHYKQYGDRCFIDMSASVNWYSFNKGINIYDIKTDKTYSLAEKSKIMTFIESPKIIRFYADSALWEEIKHVYP